MRLEHFLTSYTNILIIHKYIKKLNVKLDTTKLLEENIGRTLFDVNLKQYFALSPKVKEIKTNKNKWDLVKIKSFCSAEETIGKIKRQPIE